jgi:2-keto-4-pentenoate hydratase
MTPDAIKEAARLLTAARQSGQLLDALPTSCSPRTIDDAHAIQLATVARLHDSVVGWKVGTTPDGTLSRGALLRSRLYPGGAQVSPVQTPLLGVEAEIAFRLDRELPARMRAYEYDELADAVTAFPAIEIVDSRFHGYPDAPPLDRIADCMSNGAFVQGTAQRKWRTYDLANIEVELVFDGRTVVRREGGHPTKDPLLPALALVNDLRTGFGLSAGQMITTGSYTGLNFAKPGQSVIVTFRGFDPVNVQFDAA